MKQTHRRLLPGLLLALVLLFARRAARAIEIEFEPFSYLPANSIVYAGGDMEMGTPLDASGKAGVAWWEQRLVYKSPSLAMQSGDVGDSESTSMVLKVTGGGRMSFWWKVSSEKTYDKLTFSIDGAEKASISGEVDWEQKEYTVTGYGDHYLVWTYAKDGSQTGGDDKGWVDDIAWYPDPAPAGGETQAQTLELSPGWNWVGFRVLPWSHKVGDVLGWRGFTANDLIQTSGGMARFNGGTGWLPSGFTVDYGKMYQLYTSKSVSLDIQGYGSASTGAVVDAGWNWLSNPTRRIVTPSDLVHSGGWTAGDRIQDSGRTATYTGSKWLPSTGFELNPGQGAQVFTLRNGRIFFGQGEDDDALYAVVDLSGGPDASRYPVRYSATGPDLSDDACRTTELWLRKIPAGMFLMGSPEGEMEREGGETQHVVTLAQDYYIGVFECTQRQWELVMGGRPSYFSNAACYAGRPVEKVSYDMIRGTDAQAGAGWPANGHAVDAASFMGRLQKKTGLMFDLPTEAQWEYACRAGTTTALNSGKDLASSEEDASMADVGRYWYNGGKGSSQSSATDKGTAQVGSYMPNAWGLYDMHGNVLEWCLDWYGGNAGTDTVADPTGPDAGTKRVGRGGNYANDACYCRSAFRLDCLPSNATQNVGFRIAIHAQEPLYAVVDLSGGPSASSYPVRYSAVGPDLSDDTCRTTELWLRKIPAGTFTMGSPDDEIGRAAGSEVLHEVTLTQDYYIGVFECTQRQWELVMGSNPSEYSGEGRPVEKVSYDMIRGTGAQGGAGWPMAGHAVDASSFMGRLQEKTGLDFDLPTDAQWEYACRAGTTTALNSGKNLTSSSQDAAMAEVGRYGYNNSDGKGGFSQHTKVGSYQPNAWGLYDMHGNVFEWCLDWLKDNLGPSAVSDPVGPDTGLSRLVRGGSWRISADSCRSANRAGYDANSNNRNYCGFRVAIQPQEDLYVVVDLSGGPDARSYPVRYTNTPPDLNDDTCRTTELWLRKIPKGTFVMGAPEDEVGRGGGEEQHEVTLTQDYYIGVFECTQRQWELVTGDKPSWFSNADYYATRPVEEVSYDMIRGTSATGGAGWPAKGHAVDASSFMGKLQAKTGLVFDLPTEAQWEYACRAGTTTALNSGKNLSSYDEDANLSEVGRYWYNGKEGYNTNCDPTAGTAKVGSYLSNAWGLYDMHGDVEEWCLDWYNKSYGTAAVSDPVGPNTGSYRVQRGGGCRSRAKYCRSASRGGDSSSYRANSCGFRIAIQPQRDLYAVVDLSGGPNASSYPVRYSATGPDLSDDTCRTTELWLRKIPAGTFTMGSPSGELGRGNDETEHEVTLTQDYYIGVFECTQRQWELVMGTRPSYFNNATYYATRPVERVSYNMIRGTSSTGGAGWPAKGHAVDASSFMGKLQAKTGLVFDLPTEAQWEYACRVGSTTALNSGHDLLSIEEDSLVDKVGRYYYNGGEGAARNSTTENGTAKVGSYSANRWGLYDMHGNVYEWCLDWYNNSYGTAAVSDPVGPNTGANRVIRGGSWDEWAYYCRSAYRGYFYPSDSNGESNGFRILWLP